MWCVATRWYDSVYHLCQYTQHQLAVAETSERLHSHSFSVNFWGLNFLIRLILKSIDEYEANGIAMIFGAFDLMPFHICLVVYFRILGQNGLDHNTLNTCNHCKVRWVSVLLSSDIVYRFEHHFMISQSFVVVQTMASDTRMQWRDVHFYQLDVQQINGILCSVCVAHVNTLEDLHGLAIARNDRGVPWNTY